jgi:hypothetical protein
MIRGINTFWLNIKRNTPNSTPQNIFNTGMQYISQKFTGWFGPNFENDNLLTNNTTPNAANNQNQAINEDELRFLTTAIDTPNIITRRNANQIARDELRPELLPGPIDDTITRSMTKIFKNINAARVRQLNDAGACDVVLPGSTLIYDNIENGSRRIKGVVIKIIKAEILFTNLTAPRKKRACISRPHNADTLLRFSNMSVTNVVTIGVPNANQDVDPGKKKIYKILILMSLDSIHDKVLARLRNSGVNPCFLNTYHAKFIKGLFTNAFFLLLQIYDPADGFCACLRQYLCHLFTCNANFNPGENTTYAELYLHAPDHAPSGFEEQMFNLMRTDLNSNSGTQEELHGLCIRCSNVADNVSHPDLFNDQVCQRDAGVNPFINLAGIGPIVDGGSKVTNDLQSHFYKSNLNIAIEGADGNFEISANIEADNLLHLTFQYGEIQKTHTVNVQRHHNGTIYEHEQPNIRNFIENIPHNENDVIISIFEFAFKWSLDALQMLCLLNSNPSVVWTADQQVGLTDEMVQILQIANPQNGQLASSIRKTGDILDFVIACYMKQIFDPNGNSLHISNFLNCEKTKAYYHNEHVNDAGVGTGAGVLKVVNTAFPAPPGFPALPAPPAPNQLMGGKKTKGGTINAYDQAEINNNCYGCFYMLMSFAIAQQRLVTQCSNKEDVFNAVNDEIKHTLVSCLELISFMQTVADPYILAIATALGTANVVLANAVSELLTFLSTPQLPQPHPHGEEINVFYNGDLNVAGGFGATPADDTFGNDHLGVTYKNNYNILHLYNNVDMTNDEYNDRFNAAATNDYNSQIAVNYISNFATIEIINSRKQYTIFGNSLNAIINPILQQKKVEERAARARTTAETTTQLQVADTFQEQLDQLQAVDIAECNKEMQREMRREIQRHAKNQRDRDRYGRDGDRYGSDRYGSDRDRDRDRYGSDRDRGISDRRSRSRSRERDDRDGRSRRRSRSRSRERDDTDGSDRDKRDRHRKSVSRNMDINFRSEPIIAWGDWGNPKTASVKGGKRKTRRNKPKKTRKRFQKRSKKFQKKSRKA